ncbi:uncharacterized protein KY384_003300 [Bacidia gigantensis]|uniref:uncharacterized protein n=1 Tax=Bacidia gigantensis TaxID=2732470 RepID=UPI001D0510A4|nr:uncharacterized protein KY384_003300 [Bacidia gigantensis]KAG8531668.1 hypothetical protein KY384_003300 [Bacidia gigantensis]
MPRKIHDLSNAIVQKHSKPQWIPCHITIDRAIFSKNQSSRKNYVEYKYQTVLTAPDDYLQPLKQHFTLLRNEEVVVSAEQSSVGSNTGSTESWDAFKAWLWTCITEHRQCAPSYIQRRLPRRLLEVGHANTIRLRDVENIENHAVVDYIALSHCWGLRQPLTLRSDTEAMLYHGVEVLALPKTFRDAIQMTRRFWHEFEVRYLWIDSLCIMQDSTADWRHESAFMGEIYHNAFCTLAATAAKNGDHGLFFDRDPRRILPCAIPVVHKQGERRHSFCVDHNDWSNNISKAPLNDRSWVLQERLLSPRVLHFAADQLYWECSGLEASEAFPRGFPAGFGEQFKQLLPYSGVPRIQGQAAALRGTYKIWDQVIKMYSSGKLSRSTDRLIALSGIAHKLQRTIIANDTYLAGLWKEDLAFGLLWDVEVPHEPEPHSEFVAPTWSWAARSGTLPCEEEPWASAVRVVTIVSATVLPADSDWMGQVRGGYIRMSGVLARGGLFRVYVAGSPSPHIALKINNTSHPAVCRLDEKLTPTAQMPHVIYCLPILRGLRNHMHIYKGLLLAPTGLERQFRRHGTFTADALGDHFRSCCAPSMNETGKLGPDGRFEFTIV